MEISGVLSLHSSEWTSFGKIGGPRSGFIRVSPQRDAEVLVQKVSFGDTRSRRELVVRRRKSGLQLYCSYEKSGAAELKQETSHVSNEGAILKREAKKVVPFLNGRCVYLVGMMGSGKTTVGKILSEALGYSFVDSDKLVEHAIGATSVAQIFKDHSEEFFRDNETKVLKDLSTMHQFVVATGGGVVIRPLNWRYMKKGGVTVWLDVPLEALARRIAAVGTASRPLLPQEPGDAYTEALKRLNSLFEERGEAYENADARVSLQYIAGKQDTSALTPTAIAIEALVRMHDYLIASRLEEVHISRDGA